MASQRLAERGCIGVGDRKTLSLRGKGNSKRASHSVGSCILGCRIRSQYGVALRFALSKADQKVPLLYRTYCAQCSPDDHFIFRTSLLEQKHLFLYLLVSTVDGYESAAGCGL